jgi:hypothetical protein
MLCILTLILSLAPPEVPFYSDTTSGIPKVGMYPHPSLVYPGSVFTLIPPLVYPGIRVNHDRNSCLSSPDLTFGVRSVGIYPNPTSGIPRVRVYPDPTSGISRVACINENGSESTSEAIGGKFMLQNNVRDVYWRVMSARRIKTEFSISPKRRFIPIRYAYT